MSSSALSPSQELVRSSYDGACAALELLEIARTRGLVSETQASRLRPIAKESIEEVCEDLPPNGGGPPRHLSSLQRK
jgi:hypothetical protein